jgi:hypothetical protein
MGENGGRDRASAGDALAFMLLLAAVLALCALLFPPLGLTPNRDSGVYLYAGERMLQGDALYRDVWDHKPPLVHFLNLVMVSTGAPLWGIWLLGVICIGVATWLLWLQMRRSFGRFPAAIGLLAGLVLLAASYKGNLPEEYGLALQAAAIATFASLVDRRSKHVWTTGAWIGALGGLAALLKPTLVGLWVAMLIAGLLLRKTPLSRRQRWRAVSAAAVGGAGVIGAAAAVLVAVGLWPDFRSAVIDYNLVYASGGDRWARWMASVTKLGPLGVLALGVVALLFVLGLVTRFRRSKQGGFSPAGLALATLAIIDLPFEALLAVGSGRLYLQYLTPWFPAVALLAATVAASWIPSGWSPSARRVAPIAQGLALVAVVVMTAVKIRSRSSEAEQVWLAVDAVDRMSNPGSTVLVWGAEPQVLALTSRQAPGRYAYLYPLLTLGYATPERLAEFNDDLRSQTPALLIDTSATNGVIPPLDSGRRRAWTSSDAQYGLSSGFEPIFDFFESSYRRVETIGAWDVYAPVAR